MIKTFMLLLAFTVTDPSGIDRDEKVHVLSRHFDTEQECQKYDGRHAIQKDRQQTYVKGYTVTYECVE